MLSPSNPFSIVTLFEFLYLSRKKQMTNETDLKTHVDLAKSGNRASLEKIVTEIQDNIYGLALRMLYNPSDAQDATQEILIKVITHLDSFRMESQFSTWVYRIAANYLLRYRQVEMKHSITFEEYEESLELESSKEWHHPEIESEYRSYLNEVRISCLQGLLLCLSRELRIVFLLVDVFDINSTEGAEILEISPAAFRKRLSRARERLQLFLAKNCSLVNKANDCRCGYHLASQLNSTRFDAKNILFANLPIRDLKSPDPTPLVNEMDELNQIGDLYKMNPEVKAPGAFILEVRRIIASKDFTLFAS